MQIPTPDLGPGVSSRGHRPGSKGGRALCAWIRVFCGDAWAIYGVLAHCQQMVSPPGAISRVIGPTRFGGHRGRPLPLPFMRAS